MNARLSGHPRFGSLPVWSLLMLISLPGGQPGHAESLLPVTGAAPAAPTVSVPENLREALQKVMPGDRLGELRPTPVPGVFEAVVNNGVVMISTDGKYLIMGDLIDLTNRRNLTEVRRREIQVKAVNAFGEENMIVMGAATSKRTITVFTDVDCPYCAKLHFDVPRLVREGVRVRYILYPRNGTDSETYRRSVAVWCARDRVAAVGKAKAGEKIEMKSCTNPIKKGYQLGQELGIEGTPAIVLDDGRILPGYLPANTLLARLGLGAAGQVSR